MDQDSIKMTREIPPRAFVGGSADGIVRLGNNPINEWTAEEVAVANEHINEVARLTKKETNPKDAVGSGKLPLDLCPDSLMVGTSLAFLEGALKYGRYNWRVAGVRASIYRAAAQRHFNAWWNGEDIDPDSDLPHLFKLSACIAILIDATEMGMLTDDRPPRMDIGAMVRKYTGKVKQLKDRYFNPDQYQYKIGDESNGS